jgi:hypothetical protein
MSLQKKNSYGLADPDFIAYNSRKAGHYRLSYSIHFVQPSSVIFYFHFPSYTLYCFSLSNVFTRPSCPICLILWVSLFVNWRPAWPSWYSNTLRTGRAGDRNPVWREILRAIETSPEAHPASVSMGTSSFPGVKRPERGADLTHRSNARLRMGWSYTSVSLLCLRRQVSGDLYLYIFYRY